VNVGSFGGGVHSRCPPDIFIYHQDTKVQSKALNLRASAVISLNRGTRANVAIWGRRSNPLTMPTRDQILASAARYLTAVGMILPLAYVIPIALSEISGYFGRLDVLVWMADLAGLLSVPWEMVATLLIIFRWRDLPQRFWILYCVNGLLAYTSVPIYRMHFGLYR